MDIDHIQALWRADEYELSEEVIRRMEQREVTLTNIEEAIMTGRIIEERSRGRPHRSCTILGWANRQVAGLEIGLQPLNVACAVPDLLRVITVYWEGER